MEKTAALPKKKIDYVKLMEIVEGIEKELKQAEKSNRHDADAIIRCTTLKRCLDQSKRHRESEAAAQNDVAAQVAKVAADQASKK